MKIRNPHFVAPIEAQADVLAAAISAYLAGRPGAEFVGYGTLRKDVQAVQGASRQVVNHALAKLGVVVDESGDDNA